MESAQHSQRADRRAGELRGDVGRDGGQAEHADVQYLAGVTRRLQIARREVAKAELKLSAFSGRACRFAVPLQLVADGGADYNR